MPPAVVINNIIDTLSTFKPMSKGLKDAFIDKTFDINLSNGEHLLKHGEKSKCLYFLINGIIQGYRVKGSKMLTTFISIAGDFVAAIDGIYGEVPSAENIVAAGECYLVGVKSEDLLSFFDTFPEMNVIMRKILENYYKCAHERAIVIRMGTAQEKYEYYLQSLPGHIDKVPSELVASFLDMKIATLNKIKKELSPAKEFNTKNEIGRLQRAMLEDKLYQQKSINLKDIAEHIQISTHNLSHLLNHHYQKSFSDFVNSFRVDFVIEQLKNKSNFKHVTIQALGDKAGFSSKSTFFAYFKKHTGRTPANYIKNILHNSN